MRAKILRVSNGVADQAPEWLNSRVCADGFGKLFLMRSLILPR